ncbi:MAG: hypothetical protein ACF8TS_16575 [Maioricimonas sp. JB049]
MRNLWDVVRYGLACALVVVGLNFVGCAGPADEGAPAPTAEETADHDHEHGEEGHAHDADGGEAVTEEAVEETPAPEGGSSVGGDAGADL